MKGYLRFLYCFLGVSICLLIGVAASAQLPEGRTGYSVASLGGTGSAVDDDETAGYERDTLAPPMGVHRVQSISKDNIDDIDGKYPIDLKTPGNISNSFDYDPVTGEYLFRSSVGEMEITSPLRLTPQEYNKYTLSQSMSNYWKQKNAESVENYEDKFNITDMKFSLGPAEKVFGPGGVNIKMQGSAELIFGIKYNNVQNYTLSERLRKTTVFNFDENIQLNVNATVGERIKFGMNYNTQASFAQDQTQLKLAYEGKDDDIIKAIEVGNVSLPLNTTLITGSQALFGMRAALQFGKLKIDAIVAQQQSQQQQVNSQGGSQLMDFEVDVDNYDENRHYFLSHYFRDHFEQSLASLPYISSGVTITRCEVWITNKRNNYEQTRNIVAFMDIGEHDVVGNTHWQPGVVVTPDNAANSLYDEVKVKDIRNVQTVNTALDADLGIYGIVGGQDYEKIESARKLNESEYTLNSQLGFISLKQQLNQDEVLAVAYEYTYGGKTYQVGELSTDGVDAPNTLIVKLLKGTATSVSTPLWKLMMKNIYYLGGNNVQAEKFKLNIQYKNDSSGVYVNYIPEGACANQLLIKVMGLDKLDKRNEANPDGKFDFVEGTTIYTSNGRIIFPSPEPFGSYLRKMIGNDAIADKYCFQELYDSTLVVAQEHSERNKFRISGEYQATSGSVIPLQAMNVPRGSVKVTAGGQTLTENVDYTVDYAMGTVTILNQSILASGNNINVQLENQQTFNLQRRTLVGTHLEYEIFKNFSVGGTLMHLTEMPLVTKTQVGSEPIANTIWGLNAAYSSEAAWLTKAVNAIPGINATAPSSLTFNAEVAQLIPGHRKVDGNPGYAYLDDFESTETTIDLRYPYYWHLCATPVDPDEGSMFPEATMTNNIEYGKNRALFNFYVIDNTVFNRDNSQTPDHLRRDKAQLSNHLTREVIEQELFPNREAILGQSSTMSVLNLSFYPSERGPYNLDTNVYFDDAAGKMKLKDPKNRWGGMFRKLETSDFESANIEYLEFWMMDPFVYDTLGANPGGDLYFNLGDVSEDILRDGKKFFENGMPTTGDTTLTDRTVWGRVPRMQSTVLAFDGSLESRKYQDVGFNGLNSEDEKSFPAYRDYLASLRNILPPHAISKMESDPLSPFNDPAGDDYHHFRGTDYDGAELGILERYKLFNNPEGNSPASDNTVESYSTSATTVPDAEDINQDNTLNEYEKYYQYKVSIRKDDMQVGTNYIVNKVVTTSEMADGSESSVTWYQFKIPVREYAKRVGSIRDFRSIRFMRVFMTNFEQEMHLRFGTLELVRGEWRKYNKPLYTTQEPPLVEASLDVSSVNIEEHDNKEPVNYVLPPNVTRVTDPSQPQLTQQNEQSMLMKVMNLSPDDSRAVYKNLRYDMRKYKRLQMFAHAEKIKDDLNDLGDYECSIFLRIGSDHTENYYEYEIPLKITPEGHYGKWSSEVWPEGNMFDFSLDLLTDVKSHRNNSIRQTHGSMARPYSEYDPDHTQNKVTIVGNPNLGEIKTMLIGVRNHGKEVRNIEVWVNELRLTEYDEKPSWAALGNLGVNFSDVGSFNVSARYEQAGFGGIEQSLASRRLDDLTQVNLSLQWDFGRFFPDKANVRIPAYYSYGYESRLPEYNPMDEDVPLRKSLESLQTKQERDSLRNLSMEKNISHSFNVTNMKVDLRGKTPRIWDPANFSISYSYTNLKDLDPETARDFTITHNAQFNYNFSTTPKSWEPFKGKKSLEKWKILTEWGMNYEPSLLAFNVNLARTYSETQLRDLTGAMQVDFSDPHNSLLSFSKDFTWARNFQLNYNLTKNIKFTLTTQTNSRFDETRYSPVNREFFPSEYELWKDTIRQSIAAGGRPLAYQQSFTASWDIPVNKIPGLDWITARAQYSANYNWSTAVVYDGQNSMGNSVSNMAQWQGDGAMNFETLYNKSKYVQELNRRLQQRSGQGGRRQQKFNPRTFVKTITITDTADVVLNHKLNSDKFEIQFADKKGKPVEVKYKIKDKNNIVIKKLRKNTEVKITITTKDPNADSPAELAGLYTVRVLMMVRKLQVSYKGSSSVSMPGFASGGRFFGQTAVNGKLEPGLDFAFGAPGEKYLERALSNGWLVMNDSIVNPSAVNKSSDFDGKLSLEPVPGFKIELQSKRAMTQMISVQTQFQDAPTTYSGTFRMTTCMLASAFWSTGKAADNYSSRAFNDFLANREIIARRVQEKYDNTVYPTTGFMRDSRVAGMPYNPDNGQVNRNSADVLIPAFLAAYSGKDPSSQSLDLFPGFLAMLPNWKITYDGLGKLKSMQKVFRSFSITHAYQCVYNVGSYTSYSNYVDAGGGCGFVKDVTTGNPIPSSPYNITSVNVTESLNPLIGIDMALKNSLLCKVEYKRQRTLTLNISSNQLMEAKNNEWVVGLGYVLKDFDIMLKLKNNRLKKVKNDLTLRCDFSLKDISTLLRKMDSVDDTQATNGNKTIGVKFSAEYVFSSMLSFKLFCDYQTNKPYISTSYPIETCDVGLSVKFMLTR